MPAKLRVPPKGTGEEALWTRDEVAAAEGLVYIVEDRVIRVPPTWASRHPGGELLLRDAKGADITLPFLGNHRPEVVAPFLKIWDVGRIASPAGPAERDLLAVVKKVTADPAWFKTSPLFYAGIALRCAALLCASAWLVLTGASAWTRVLVAGAALGGFFQQMAFIGHDTGHNGITHHPRLDTAIGLLVGNALTGISSGWWRASHHTHHLVTNSVEADPDIQHLPIFAVDKALLSDFFSTYHEKWFKLDAVARVLLRYQHFLFYPVMALARFNLYIQSLLFVAQPSGFHFKGGKSRAQELLSLAFFWTWFSLLVAQLPSAGEAIGFLLTSHAVAGFLHVQICVSHFAMPVIEGAPLRSKTWLEHQLEGTTDYACSPYIDWLHGGLQFQVAHHLVPRMPRHNLRRLREEVLLPLFARHGLKYEIHGFMECNWLVLKTLRQTASSLSPFFFEGINIAG
jgi:delta8-fatty-acid desaturase